MHDKTLIRRLRPSDSITELTALLRRAYAGPAARGIRFFASYQDDAATRRRADRGECYVAVDRATGKLVGTITFVPPWVADGSDYYARPDVAWFGQFAVDPPHQQHGLGSRLIDLAERRAAETGAAELALDTAERADDLIAYYRRRGYAAVAAVQWDGADYRSVVMSKRVGRRSAVEAHVAPSREVAMETA